MLYVWQSQKSERDKPDGEEKDTHVISNLLQLML